MTLAIMFQGTGSDVGKSVLVAGFCRLLVNRGFRVRPFKPQNMSNNAAVTDKGEEIGRAQALQATACKIKPTVHMNPVLLKPQSDIGAQIIVQGKVSGTSNSSYFKKNKHKLLEKIIESFECLKDEADIIVVEGAGSPAEVNLREHDVANMGFARAVNIPVILIGDIDRGGVIASIVGTHEILSKEDRDLIYGYIINKFRGDMSLFDDAHDVMTSRTGWNNIGVLPFISSVKKLPPEDAVILDHYKENDTKLIKIAVPMLSRIANFDDFDPLIAEPDVQVIYVRPGEVIPSDADLIIIPGTKATLADLAFLRDQKWDIDIASHVRQGKSLLGICGGYQMLGNTVSDPDGIEGHSGVIEGLGYLNVDTIMRENKRVTQTKAYCEYLKCETSGYEIHIGETNGPDTKRSYLISEDQKLGAANEIYSIIGIYLHGLFVDDKFRARYLGQFRHGKIIETDYRKQVDQALDELANAMEQNLDVNKLIKIAELK